MIPIYEMESFLSEYPDSRDLKIVVDGGEASFHELVKGEDGPELHIKLNGTGL